MIEALDDLQRIALTALFNPAFLFLLLILFFVGKFIGKLTKNMNIWKILLLGYCSIFLFPAVRDAGLVLGGIFVLGMLSNHVGTFLSVLSWSRNIPEAIFAFRYRSAYEDIRRREKEIEERERLVKEEECRQAYQQRDSDGRSKAGWQKDAKGFRKKLEREKPRSEAGSRQQKNTGSRHSKHKKNTHRNASFAPNDVRVRHLQTLGLDPTKNHSRESIKKAFRRKVMKAHPDAGGSQAEFVAIKSAYEWLNTTN